MWSMLLLLLLLLRKKMTRRVHQDADAQLENG
jgi:hypothetical protein